MGFAEAIAGGLGYQGTHLHLLRAGDYAALEAEVWALVPALAVRTPAAFHWLADKRATITLSLEHFLAPRPTPQSTIPLAAGPPLGTVAVNRDPRTLCLARRGA